MNKDHDILLAERLEDVTSSIEKVQKALKTLRDNKEPENKPDHEETIAIYERFLTKLQKLQKQLMVESNELVYD